MNQTINISMPQVLLDEVRALVAIGEFSSISDARRHATRSMFSTDYSIPIMKMSKRSLKHAAEANKLYKKGKLKPINSVMDLL